MLADTKKARPGVRNLFASWLPLGKLAAGANPEERETYAALLESSLLFVEDLILGDGDRSFKTMLSADYAFVNQHVAPSYGLSGITGPEFQRITLTDQNRAGLLTQPAYLVATADSTLATIIRRGKFVTERLASCQPVPTLQGPIPDPPARKPDQSVRQYLSAHAEGSCRGCHQYMDAAGFAFDAFDSLGRVREADDFGKPLDTSGVLLLGGSDVSFSGAADMFRQLSENETAERCFAQQVSRFALRSPGDAGARGSLKAAGDAFVEEDGDIYELLVAATQSYSFFYRKPAAGEVVR
jgi:hypothetical protein